MTNRSCVVLGGIVEDNVTAETTRVVSSLPTVLDVRTSISGFQPPSHTLFHTTEWISRSLSGGEKCSDDICRIPGSYGGEQKFAESLNTANASNDVSPPRLHRQASSQGSGSHFAEPLVRRTSSSKTKFADLKFGEPGFGEKTKSQNKKRSRDESDSPPEGPKLRKSTEHDYERDSFARLLIRKKVKYEDFDAADATKHGFEPPKHLVDVENFELVYEEESEDDEEVGSYPLSFIADGFQSPVASQAPAPEEIDKVVPRDLPRSIVGQQSTNTDELVFSGVALPRLLTGNRAVVEDDPEDPKFFALLKPVAQGDEVSEMDDAVRYAGPWAGRYEGIINAAAKESLDDEFVIEPKQEAKKEVKKSKLLILDSDSDENDFSESQVAFDGQDFSKNFGHSQRPISAYWERQKAKLACQRTKASPAGEVTYKSDPAIDKSSAPSNPTDAGGDDSNEEEESDGSGVLVLKGKFAQNPKKMADFADPNQPLLGGKVNHNKVVTDHLEQLEKICLGSGDRWRGYAYRKASNILKSLTYKVETAEEAAKLRGIGSSIAQKIGEIVSTGKLRKLEALQSEERVQVLSLFMGIFGVGQSTANKWAAMGLKTLEELQSKGPPLTYGQAVGVKYYDDFQKRIPREEMERICSKVKNIVLTEIDENYYVEICGSYRRGAADCGDIDIIITHNKTSALKNLLPTLIPKLHTHKVLTHDFVSLEEDSDKYMGVCQASATEPHRRIDILTVLPAEWPFALLYFTGSGHFNRSMRFWAGKRGYSLSQHGLRVNYGNDNKGPCIAGITTEKQIFEALGLEWRPPEDRDV